MSRPEALKPPTLDGGRPAARPVEEASPAEQVTGHVAMARLADMLGFFEQWLNEWGEDAARWIAFDQFIRHRLHQTVKAERVRCFRVVCGGQALESLVPAQGKLHALVPTAQGILGYVATRACPYRRVDPSLGPAVHHLAESGGQAPCWCFPVLAGSQPIGVVSVGRMADQACTDPHLLAVLAGTVGLLWNRLLDMERLSAARQTDQGSGVLTRCNFFRVAEAVLADGYANFEPAIFVVLAVEGVRRLDDSGLWEQRDQLIGKLGRAIRSKVRSDDVVGRFSDDRFVALLRRLDAALGGMIARKLMDTVAGLLAECSTQTTPLKVRCGLAAAGETPRTLRQHVAAAFAAAESGRLRQVDLVCDWEQPGGGALIGDEHPDAG